MVMPYHLHMPSYFLETFTEYPILCFKHKNPTLKVLKAQQSAPAVDGIMECLFLFQEISTHRAETIYQHTRFQTYTTMHSIRFLIQTVAG